MRRDVRQRHIMIAGVPVRDTNAAALVRFFERRRRPGRQILIGFVNQNFVVACRALRPLAEADRQGVLLLDDGVGVAMAAYFFSRRRFAEDLNGTDLVPRILREVKQDLAVFLLGGTVDVVARTAKLIDAMPRRRIVGFVDGFSVWVNEGDVIAQINAARPDILLVGFGNPKQERWILEHRRELEVGTIIAVGALFEWMSGAKRRAPLALRRVHIEWLYRLALEPRRLSRRYTLDVVRFFFMAWQDRALPLRKVHVKPTVVGGIATSQAEKVIRQVGLGVIRSADSEQG